MKIYNVIFVLILIIITQSCNQTKYIIGNVSDSKDGYTIRDGEFVNIIVDNNSNQSLDKYEGKKVKAKIKVKREFIITESDLIDESGNIMQGRIGNQRTVKLLKVKNFEEITYEESKLLNSILNTEYNFSNQQIIFVKGNYSNIISKEEFFKLIAGQIPESGNLNGIMLSKIDDELDNKGYDSVITIWSKLSMSKKRQEKILNKL